MSERWRKPVIPVAVEPDTRHVLIEDGVRYQHHHVTLLPADTDRVRLGYVCIRCFEPHEQSFPARCSLCGFTMAASQREEFAREFEGDVWVGSRMSIDEEVARMEIEAVARRHRKGSSIVVPGGFR